MKQIKCLLKLCFLILVSSTLHLTPIQAAALMAPPIDTTETTVCANKLPYRHLGNTYTTEGSYYITLQSVGGRDSATIHLNLFLATNDTIQLSGCASEFPLHYEQLNFLDSTVLTTSYSQDSNGCPITHTFNVVKYPVYNDTLNTTICSTDLPYSIFDTLLTEAGTYEFHYTSVNGCDSSYLLNLTVNPAYTLTDTVIETVCSHDLPYHYGDSTFNQAGVYDFTLKTIAGCDSIGIHLDLTVIQTHYDTLTFDVCENNFPFHLNAIRIYDAPGIYEYYQNDNNTCHNVTVIVLNQLPAYQDTLRVNWCSAQGPYTFADTSFTESVTYTYASHTTLGCDSITTLVLTVNPSYNDTLVDTLTLCAYDLPYEIGDVTLLAAGDYEIDIPTAAGCDSMHLYLNLQVNDFPEDTVELTICDNNFPFDYLGHQIDSAGTYSLHISDSLTIGCDTIRQLIVNSSPTYHDSVSVTLCANVPYTIGDSTLTEPGIYDIMLQTQAGCDSLVTVTLLHNPIYYGDTLPFTICENALPFEYADTSFTTAGVHLVQLYTTEGCDSIIPINLTILPIIYNADTLQHTICADQLPYTTSFGEVIETAGLYTYTVTSVATGCDSVFYFRLKVNPNPTPIISGPNHLCVGSTANLSASVDMDQYLWNTGNTNQMIVIENAGTYRVTVTNAFGCTASVEHHVAEAQLPTFELSNTQTICNGDNVTLTITGADHYQWSTGQTSNTITVHPTATTTYQVSAYTSTPCMREGSVTVVVNELPTVAITGADAFCQGNNIELTATGATSYQWSTNSVNDHITVFNAGTIYVTGTDAHGCSNTASKLVSVYALPTVTINGRTPFCQGETTTLTASGAQSYIWDNGATTSTINTSYGGNYSVTGTDVHGCQSTANKQVTIWQVSAQISGSRNFCQGQHTTLNVTGNESYTYRWNDGSTSSSLDVYTAGQYAVTVTNSLGCSNTISATVSEYALPTPTITGPTTVCQGRNATLVAGGGTSYHWSDGTNNAYLSATATGTYFVTVTNQNGCSATTSQTVIVNPAPSITITAQPSICRGETASIYAQSSNGVQYVWPMNGLTGQLISVSPNNTTAYTVNVTDDNGCIGTATTTIVVNNNPTPHINGADNFCAGDTLTLTATGGSSYYWNNGIMSNSIQVTTGGTYSVVASNDYGCTATATKNVAANALPSVEISTDTTICQGDVARLYVQAPAGCTYLWSNGSSLNNITVNTAGTYSVTVTNPNGCSRVRTTNVTVNAKPQISISGSTSFCQDGFTTLTANCDPDVTYTWSTGSANAPLVVSAAGTYSVTASNLYGCTRTASTVVTMYNRPEVSISGTTNICPGSSTTLTSTNASRYQWSTGDTTNTISITPANSGAYRVTVTDMHGCQNFAATYVEISTVPTISITGDLNVCEGAVATLSVPTGYTYTWSNGANTNTITVAEAGNYRVTASNALGCTSTDSATVTHKPLPQLNFGVQHHICEGQSYTYTLPVSSDINYRWSNNSTGNTLTANTQGRYSVTATNQYGCSVSASDSLIVHPLPTPVISGNSTVCRGASTILTANGGISYVWSNGSTTRDIAVFPNTNTTYSVTVTDEYGCYASASKYLTVNTPPAISILGNRHICEGGATTITINGGNSYQWSNGVTTNSINITIPGTYYVTTSNILGCQRRDSVIIVSRPNPVAQILGDSQICENTVHALTATGGHHYSWSTGENTSAITIQPLVSTTYTVTAYDSLNCSTTVSKVVNVEALPDVHITGLTTVCMGETVTFTASNGHSYLWSTGSTSPTINVSESGSYSVTASSVNGCTASESIQLVVNPVPQLTLTGSSTICENTTIPLVAHGGQSYIWSNGSTDSLINITTGGTYSVTASNIYGCSSSTTQQVTSLQAPYLLLNTIGSLCQGGSTSIMAFGTATQYTWDDGTTGQSYTVSPTSNTMYHVTATNDNGCTTVDSTLITVNPVYHVEVNDAICQNRPYNQYGFSLPSQITAGTFDYQLNLQTVHGCDSIITLHLTVNPIPVVPATISGPSAVTAHGSQMYTVENAQYVNTYEWRCSNVNWGLSNTNMNSVFLNINQNGSGVLTAKAINECGAVETFINIYCNVGIEEYVNETNIQLYPVPAHQFVNVNLEQSISNVNKIQLIDNLGRVLQTVQVTESNFQIDLTPYATGTYFLRFYNENGKSIDTRKLIIR